MANIEYRSNPELKILRDDWKGNACVDGRFVNESPWCGVSVLKALKWRFGKNPQRQEKRSDKFRVKAFEYSDFSRGVDRIVWLGHSSFFISIAGINLLTDPCLIDLPMVHRKVDLPCRIKEIKPIDYLLVSHDHRDHFDARSFNLLRTQNPDMQALVPLGMSGLVWNVRFQEAGWYQKFSINGSNLQIVMLPAKHWCRRGLTDYNKRLWGSFLIISKKLKIYFAGDTGYDASQFREIHRLFGNVDVCLLPIGAYAPRWMMGEQHIDPEEAVKAFVDLGGYVLVPMHYGTYDLSDEPPGEPLRLLRRYAREMGCEGSICDVSVGDVLRL